MRETDIIEKYRKKIEGEVAGETDFSRSYSSEYRQFRQDQLSTSHTLYEGLCNFAEKILPITPSEKDLEEVSLYTKLTHLHVTPESVFSLAYLTAIISIIVAATVTLLTFNFIILAAGLIVAVILLYLLPKYPKRTLVIWRSQASDELVLAVLYLTIYMQHTPNLERAVAFVAKHISPPLSIDFMKILWDVETKTYSSVTDALNDYAQTWKDWDPQFVDSLRLIETSLYEGNLQRKKEILDKALQVILEGTQDKMLGFAHKLKSPLESLHMLGLIIFSVVGALPIYYFYNLLSLPAQELKAGLFSQLAVFASIGLVAAVGIGLGIYYYLSVSQAINLKKRIQSIEETFTDSIFQLGQRLNEHLPVEVAFERIAKSEKSEIAIFYKKVVRNISNLGLDLRSAIFDPKHGAINDYPSSIMISTMQVVIEGAKRSPEIVGQSLVTISEYLRSVNRVAARMQDLLAETTSSMQMQVKIFVPVIAGIVVGLAVLTISILRSLGQQLGGIGGQSTAQE